jgi:hypothetical protein
MKRYGLLLTTLASMVLSAWSLCGAGWFSDPTQPTPSPEATTLSAAWHYHHSQARHWRNCLLQH